MRAPIALSIAICVSLWAQPGFLCGAVAGDAIHGDSAPTIGGTAGSGVSRASPGAQFESWRRVRAQGSSSGTETAAILHIADFERSDPRLAGLMLRCGERSVEVIIVVVEPFPPHTRPKITLLAAGRESYFQGDVIPTGAGVRLPVDGWMLATGPWLGAQEVGIKISDGASTVDGVVSLSGLTPALQSLIADCARK